MVATKTFLNIKKILIIPPLSHENKFVTNLMEKAALFNSFFAKHCSLINNKMVSAHLDLLTENRLYNLKLKSEDILKIIQNLDPSKAHCHDKISIRMLKLCQ